MKIEINEFIKTIKLELENYEDMTKEQIEQWEATFQEMVKNKTLSKKNFNDDIHFEIHDESEIFSIADDYYSAIEYNDLKTYWNTFK